MSLTKMESSYATSIELQSSVAVRTAERGLSHPHLYLAWELFNCHVAELSICRSFIGTV
jgi:hypothetical protein